MRLLEDDSARFGGSNTKHDAFVYTHAVAGSRLQCMARTCSESSCTFTRCQSTNVLFSRRSSQCFLGVNRAANELNTGHLHTRLLASPDCC